MKKNKLGVFKSNRENKNYGSNYFVPDYVRENWTPFRTRKEGYRPQYERLLLTKKSY